VKYKKTVVSVLLLPWCQRKYRDPAFSVVHGVNVQLITDPVIMPAKEEHGCDSGSESLDKHEPRDMLKDVVKVSLFQKGQNDRIKNIAFVFYGIQCSLNILS
jgi:hypothetical protein